MLRRFAEVILVVLGVFLSSCTRDEPLVEVRLESAANETSALLSVSDALLEAGGWKTAFWTVSDEGRVEDSIALIAHDDSSPQGAEWKLLPVDVQLPGGIAPETDDSEVLCRHGAFVYVLGSHFGKKAGPLQAKRHFIARFSEPEVSLQSTKVSITMEVAQDAFLLHRIINDALRDSGIEIIERSAVEVEAFITSTQQEYADEPWIDRIHDDDWPINIEGAAFTASGSLLLGLRYPVTRTGKPLLVALADVDALFADDQKDPTVENIWTLDEAGGATNELMGVRALDRAGDIIHVITGNIDSRPESSVLLKAHPDGASANSVHYVVRLEPSRQTVSIVRDLTPFRDVEGVSTDSQQRVYYLRDEATAVRLYFDE